MSTVIEFSGASSTIVDIEDSETSAGVGVEPSSSVKPTEKAESDSFTMVLVLVCAPVGGTLVACILLSCCILLCLKRRARGRKAT
jgi:hypothetical protein